jgi:hypothetical protein
MTDSQALPDLDTPRLVEPSGFSILMTIPFHLKVPFA